MVKPELLLVPRDMALPHYGDWFAQRKVKCPLFPTNGIFVAHAELGPICGVGIYQTDGPYFFLENFCSNPKVSKRLVHKAAGFMLEAAKAFGAMTSKYPILSANSRGLVQVCQRAGFAVSRSVGMYGTPMVALSQMQRAKRKRR
jgi:hypothetical protein